MAIGSARKRLSCALLRETSSRDKKDPRSVHPDFEMRRAVLTTMAGGLKEEGACPAREGKTLSATPGSCFLGATFRLPKSAH